MTRISSRDKLTSSSVVTVNSSEDGERHRTSAWSTNNLEIGAENHLGKTTPSSPERDSSLNPPVLNRLAQHETSTLANYATNAGDQQTRNISRLEGTSPDCRTTFHHITNPTDPPHFPTALRYESSPEGDTPLSLGDNPPLLHTRDEYITCARLRYGHQSAVPQLLFSIRKVPSHYIQHERTRTGKILFFSAIASSATLSSKCLAAVLVASAVAEPPSGYNYNRPSIGGVISTGFGGVGGGGGGGYIQVSPSFSTNEGASVDPELLEKIRQILLREESSSVQSVGGYQSQPSSAYGVPSSQYGVPSGGAYYTRVVGVDLEGIRQAIQVAQYQQSSYQAGGYPASGYAASSSYSQPRPTYNAPRPSSSYGSPF
uniref:Uncharacterized protein n=1 Tax=Timema poppense TaxID=170557 RepID=A0A7R9DIZ3_TIMPO|nr:unnamed protein product [Timema poppensis]